MKEAQAAYKADLIVLEVIKSQAGVLGSALYDVENAERAAEAIAALRRRLIVKFSEQGE